MITGSLEVTQLLLSQKFPEKKFIEEILGIGRGNTALKRFFQAQKERLKKNSRESGVKDYTDKTVTLPSSLLNPLSLYR